MEPLNLEGPMRRIAKKHGIDLSKLDIQKILDARDARKEQEAIRFTQINNQIKMKTQPIFICFLILISIVASKLLKSSTSLSKKTFINITILQKQKVIP